MNKYPTKLAIILKYPPEKMIGESIFDGRGIPIGWIADAVDRADEPDTLKLHERMNAVLLDMNEELLAYHPQDRENASSKELIDCVIRAHQIIEDAATVGIGTCKGEIDTDYFECKLTTFKCKKCGWSGVVDNTYAGYSFDGTDMPRHCPSCGARIIEEETE